MNDCIYIYVCVCMGLCIYLLFLNYKFMRLGFFLYVGLQDTKS